MVSDLTATSLLKVPWVSLISRSENLPNPRAASSRAIEFTPNQSGRFGVTSKSIVTSSMPSAAAADVPTATSSGNSIMPDESPVKPNSSYEHIIPFDTTPRTGRASSVTPNASTHVPMGAKIVVRPARAFGAPHTISRRP